MNNHQYKEVWCNDLIAIHLSSKSIQRLTPIQYTPLEMKKSSWPFPRNQSTLLYKQNTNQLIVFGGFNEAMHSSRFNDLFVYDLTHHVWNYVSPKTSKEYLAPQARVGHASCLLSNDQLLIYGGKNYLSQLLNDFWIFDFETETWKSITIQNWTDKGRSGAVLTRMDVGRVLLHGGKDRNNVLVNDNEVILINLCSNTCMTLKMNTSIPMNTFGRCFGTVHLIEKESEVEYLQRSQISYKVLVLGGYNPQTNENMLHRCMEYSLQIPFHNVSLHESFKAEHFTSIVMNLYHWNTRHGVDIFSLQIEDAVVKDAVAQYWYGIFHPQHYTPQHLYAMYQFCMKNEDKYAELKQQLQYYIGEQLLYRKVEWKPYEKEFRPLKQEWYFSSQLFPLLQQMKPQWISSMEEQSNDVLYFGSETCSALVVVNRNMVFANSEYFYAMCGNAFQESSINVILLQDYSLHIWKIILDFICGATCLQFETLGDYIDVCKCAHQISLHRLFDLLIKELNTKYLSIHTVKPLLQLAMRYEMELLQQNCLQCIRMSVETEEQFTAFLEQLALNPWIQ